MQFDMDELKIKHLYVEFGKGISFWDDNTQNEIESAIDEWKKNRGENHYLISIDGHYCCVNFEQMKEYFNEEIGKEQVESTFLKEYTMENFYTYCAVEVLKDANYSLEETVKLLCQ